VARSVPARPPSPPSAAATKSRDSDGRRAEESPHEAPLRADATKRQSGGNDPALGISKAGDPYLRRTLVQSAQYILGHFGPDTALRRFGGRLIARGGRSARKRAAVAVARKLAVLLHRLWMTGEHYDPLRGVPIDAIA
jgi:transposase